MKSKSASNVAPLDGDISVTAGAAGRVVVLNVATSLAKTMVKIGKFYNKKVKNRINKISKLLNIPKSKYEPKDIKGEKHMLGVFEHERESKEYKYSYMELITQGAKKYATKFINKKGKEEIKITVAGVPKGKGSKALKDLNDFRDDYIFRSSDTEKQTIIYLDEQICNEVIDKDGVSYLNTDTTGCCMIPCSYILGKALDYCNLLTDNSSKRAIFREEMIEDE